MEQHKRYTATQPKEPNGLDLLATLINLLADQEGVKITYTLERRNPYEETECTA